MASRIGLRSAILFALLGIWILLCLCWAIFVLVAGYPSEYEWRLNRYEGSEDVAFWGFFGIVCPCAGLLIVGLPLLVAAIVTLRKK